MGAQPAVSQTPAHWIILTFVWKARVSIFHTVRHTYSIFTISNGSWFSCINGGVILGRTFPLSVEYNDSLFTRLFLLIHLQSVIHFFNIPSNPINWPCLVCLSVHLALLFSSYEHMRRMCMYSRGRDEMVLCFLEELATFTHIGLLCDCQKSKLHPAHWAPN